MGFGFQGLGYGDTSKGCLDTWGARIPEAL